MDEFLAMLGYDMTPDFKAYWLLPGKTLEDGLRVISTRADFEVMKSVVHKVKNFIIYFDQGDTIAGVDWDDVVANPISELPKVLSPRKMSTADRKVPNKQDDSDSDGSLEDDPDFMDSDYDISDADDDLYVDNVDVGVEDLSDCKAKFWKKAKGSQLKGKEIVVRNSDGEEVSTDDEDLQLPDSDDDGEVRLKFKAFMAEDVKNPVFKVGMVFPSVEVLRKAITEYSLKARVDIKMPRNEQKRLRAHCVEGCPWNLYASFDSRSKSMMVKTYLGEHKCQKEWVLKRCTAKWLSEKYIETFRANDKMTLGGFAKLVQLEWNLTPSRSKLARARRLAFKDIYGDEIQQYNQLWNYGAELRRSNPGSCFFLNLVDSCFNTCYMSFDACKRGFLSGCRPLICLDGCHIKTKFGGQILTAVGIDPNDCIYPIAIAVVETESLRSWRWFLQTLKEDLGIDNTYPWTIMTDKQKVYLFFIFVL